MSEEREIHPWEKLGSELRGHYKVFSVRQDRSRSPETGDVHDFYVIDSPDWVNVIPVTPEGRVVCIEQYRHGIEAVTLEVPGGIVDPEDETPAAAARREMVEETGYDADRIVPIGRVAPNPAIQGNTCHSFLALDARPVQEQALDGAEEIRVRLVDADELPRLVAEGRISHALVVAALYFYEQHRRAGERRR